MQQDGGLGEGEMVAPEGFGVDIGGRGGDKRALPRVICSSGL